MPAGQGQDIAARPAKSFFYIEATTLNMQKPRVLLIAEAANPEWSSVPLIGWSLSTAIAKVTNAHIVTQLRNREAFLRAGLRENVDFTAIDSEAIQRPIWKLSSWLRGGTGAAWTVDTALASITYPYFERLVWKRFGPQILAGEFDIVHRITPLTPTAPSPMARRCARAGIPFVVGPLNGGVPWPKAFDAERRREKEWLSYVRSVYRFLPGWRSTFRHAAVVIAGSRFTLDDLPKAYRDKYEYMPENGIDPARFWRRADGQRNGPLRAAFVGRLVPYKGPDMLLDAAAALLREGQMTLELIGDGPLMPVLKDQAQRLGVSHAVNFHGWVPNEKVQDILCGCEIMPFPSIREFGGGVVLEAMALGVVPIVVDYAGPGELVSDETGFKIPLGSRAEIVTSLARHLTDIHKHRDQLGQLAENGLRQIQERFTWSAKADHIVALYRRCLETRSRERSWSTGQTSSQP